MWLCCGRYTGRSVRAFARFAKASWSEHTTQEAYRIYTTNALRCISEGVSRYAGGPYIGRNWYDIVYLKPEDNRSPEEVVNHMKNRLKEVSAE